MVVTVSMGRGYYVSGKNTDNLKGCIKKVTLNTFLKRQDLDTVLPLGHALHFPGISTNSSGSLWSNVSLVKASEPGNLGLVCGSQIC